MKIAFQVPHLSTIYAGRTIYNGYKNAFTDLDHEFKFLTANDNQSDFFSSFKPDILFTSINDYFIKYLDLELVLKQKKAGLKVFVNTPFWRSPFSTNRINEARGLATNSTYLKLINKIRLGDIYYNSCEAEDERMLGFTKTTGFRHHTILLAADPHMHYFEYSKQFNCDISYLGTNLPGKRKFIFSTFPKLNKSYDTHLYGQDWTTSDKVLGLLQRTGQYFNIPLLNSVQKPKLALSDERKIYSSSAISLNLHEDYQLKYGGDLNERTFKIPACAGFQLCDDVLALTKYFNEGKDVVTYSSKDDFMDKVNYYMQRPELRRKIALAGQKYILSHHTYAHRVSQILKLYKELV